MAEPPFRGIEASRPLMTKAGVVVRPSVSSDVLITPSDMIAPSRLVTFLLMLTPPLEAQTKVFSPPTVKVGLLKVKRPSTKIVSDLREEPLPVKFIDPVTVTFPETW